MNFRPNSVIGRLRTAILAGLMAGTGAIDAGAQPFDELPEQLPAPAAAGVVRVETAWNATAVRPGGQITLAVVLDIDEPYHVNADTAKEPFIPTRVTLLDIPDPLRASTVVYPPAHDLAFGPAEASEMIEVFSGRTVIFVPIAVDGSAPVGPLTLQVNVEYQACDDTICLMPVASTHAIVLNVVDPATPIQPTHADLFKDLAETQQRLNVPFFGWDFAIDPTTLWLLLLIAAAGGFLLNLTPCVLPLIPIKMMGIAQAAESRRRALVLGLIMSAGVVTFWLALGSAIAFVSDFTAANQLFQYPAFTIGVGAVIALMAVGMCGLFAARLPQWVYAIKLNQKSVHGSFLFGIMTAVLSTPCTAPFMGAAAAWAATQSPAITLCTFAAIGGGMALPYLVLSAIPGLVDRMPRTGPGSELIKQVMGLLMFAAAAYFIGAGLSGLVVRPPDPPPRAYWWAVAVCGAAAGVWLAWRTWRIRPGPVQRIAFVLLGAAIVGASVDLALRFTDRGPINWVYYTPQRLAEAQNDAKIVVLEFTAEWCLNCHALEQTVLHDRQVVALLNGPDVAAIKVDITGNNVAGNQKLLAVGRRTIPLLIVYDRSGKEVLRSDAYTAGQLIDAINRAKSPPS